VRILIFLLLTVSFITLSLKKRKIFYFVSAFVPLAMVLTVLWYKNSPQSIPSIFYFLAFIAMAVGLLISMRRMPLLGYLLTNFLFFLTIILAVWSVMACVAFNFHLVPFRMVNLGGFDYYNFYYNPLLGYIDPRPYENGIIGRASVFMFEPSFMGWFLTTNFFLIDKYVKTRGWRYILSKLITFLGIIGTFSTGAIAVMVMVISLNVFFFCLRKVGFRERTVNIIALIFIIGLPLAYLLVPKDNIGSAVGSSSLGDREERMQNSLFILGTSGGKDILLGHAPGYIENADFGKGESNQYMKMVVEEGVLLTILILGFIAYCTKRHRSYMLANLLFLNSVIIVWTPLFLINILVCKWLETSQEKEIPVKI